MTGTEPTLKGYVWALARTLLVASIIALAFTKIGPYRFGPFELASPTWTFWILAPTIIASSLIAYIKVLPESAAVWRAQVSEAEIRIGEHSERLRAEAEVEAAELIEQARAEAEAEAAELIEQARAEAEAEAAELIEQARSGAAALTEEGAELARANAAAEIEQREAFDRSVWKERGDGFPTVVAMLEEIDERQDEDVADWLASKGTPAPRAADVVRDQSRRRRVAERERRIAQSIVEYYESVAPFLLDLKKDTLGEEARGVATDADEIESSDSREPIVRVVVVEQT